MDLLETGEMGPIMEAWEGVTRLPAAKLRVRGAEIRDRFLHIQPIPVVVAVAVVLALRALTAKAMLHIHLLAREAALTEMQRSYR